MSTAERRKHSTSPEESTGRPLVVSSAGGNQFPAIDDDVDGNNLTSQSLRGERIWWIMLGFTGSSPTPLGY